MPMNAMLTSLLLQKLGLRKLMMLLCQSPPDDIDELVACYNVTLKSVLDKHAPFKNKGIIERTCVPWFNEEIKEVKRKCRKAERTWRDTSGNQKKLFTATMKLINESKTRDLPPVPDNAVCASSIAKFYRKIANIREQLDSRILLQDILLDHMSTELGIEGVVLKWFGSYLKVRYLSFNPSKEHGDMQAAKSMELCVNDIMNWMSKDKRLMNDDKMESY
ncbi:Hypothetical predicted protein [Paramuricea clavata]|uniref:Uncharacterized protein n=1 Tax=Paramuricea clavata TaxID=317549 RepID=A0A6S7GED5_PARCT|nr:Hypothetical predicted protein [Paramuricea clavata]